MIPSDRSTLEIDIVLRQYSSSAERNVKTGAYTSRSREKWVGHFQDWLLTPAVMTRMSYKQNL